MSLRSDASPSSMSPCSTAMILSSASPPSIIRKPPTGLHLTSRSPWFTGRLDNTQMSSGSPSPTMPGRCFAAKLATSSAQYVCGRKPYSVGHTDENLCGLSTDRKPVSLSISNLIDSSGAHSMYAVNSCGAPLPRGTPCHGFGRNNMRNASSRRSWSSSEPLPRGAVSASDRRRLGAGGIVNTIQGSKQKTKTGEERRSKKGGEKRSRRSRSRNK
mmetsp:Transcript_6818/g.21958  ORF Transcript_6818/g.21958 Transcript_6818/m.21958 type:complete len:215 (-) Transcript_6818:59-703(-)